MQQEIRDPQSQNQRSRRLVRLLYICSSAENSLTMNTFPDPKRELQEKKREKIVIWISLQNHSQKLDIDEMKPYGSSSNLKQIENRTSKEQQTLYFERIV